MSPRGILISLAANFVVAGIVWNLKGPSAGIACLLIGFLLFIAAFVWPKKKTETANTPPPFSQIITQEANPRIENTVIVHRDIPPPLKRTSAEQHDYDKTKKALELLKEKGVIALRYIRAQECMTFNFSGYTAGSLPPGLTTQDVLWVYRHCASEGILNCKKSLGNHEETYTVPARMGKILDEVLFEE